MAITRKVLIVIIVLAMLVGVNISMAAGVVNPCTEANLRTAVSGGGTVTFNCGVTTITLTTPLDITAPNTTIDGGGQITLSGGNSSAIIHHRSLSTSTTLTLKNLTIQSGKASGTTTSANGGAVWSVFQGSSPGNKPTLNVINVKFLNNVSAFTTIPGNAFDYGGGAIYSQGGYLNVSGSQFIGNTADGGGGAIHILRSNISITGSIFTNNQALGLASNNNQGGAIYIDGMQANGSASIGGSTFTGNQTHNEGGAVYIHMYLGLDSFIVDQSTFNNNAVNGGDRSQGGAISGGNGKVTITNSLFSGNSVTKSGGDGSGGAISLTQPSVITIANSTFNGNHANGTSYNANGGAIYIVNNSAQFKIINSTIANNTAGWAGGGISSSTNGSLQNTILANNTADNGPNHWGILQQCSAMLVNGGGNIQYPPRNPNPNYYNEIVCATGITIADPLLDTLSSNLSSRPTMALKPGSPAIDRGNPTVCAAAPVNNRDQRGQTRLIDGDSNGPAICDSGAFEYNSAPLAHYGFSPPQLTWAQVSWAQNYEVQVDDDSTFNSLTFTTIVPSSTLAVTSSGLTAPNVYYWRVRAQRSDGSWSGWSAIDSFVLNT